MSRDTFLLRVPRTVTELGHIEDEDRSRTGRPFLQYFDDPAIVVLGDPGLGKTVLFREMAAEEGGLYTTVRDFLDLSLDRFRHQVLYLDGLDEVRSGSSDASQVTGSIRRRLDELGMPKYRLSCRPADWFGGLDVSLLSSVSASGSVTTLRLEPLTEQDVLELAAEKLGDVTDFLQTAQNHGLEELLYNPLTLLLLLGVVQAGEWPQSRKMVYERGLRLLVQERNETHEQTEAGGFSTNQILEAASRVFAIYILSGINGIALVRGAERPSKPFVGDIPGAAEAHTRAALRRRLFTVTNEQAEPVHRTAAEFLGAQYLARRIEEGLPAKRALSLLQGRDGGILSDRRGLFAWLVTLSPHSASTMLPLDPLAVVLYGDPTVLSAQVRIELVNALGKLSQDDPYFRADVWEGQPFGALAARDTSPLLLEIIEDRTAPKHLAITALDALTYGTASPELGDRLLSFIRDGERPQDLRYRCLRALLHNCQGEWPRLRQLLEDIAFQGLSDPDGELRGELLSALFPQTISPRELPGFLIVDQVDDDFGASYWSFLHRNSINRLDDAGVKELLDVMAESSLCRELGPRPGFHFRAFLGQIVMAGLERLGETVDLESLKRWLALPVSRLGRNVLDNRHREAVRQWFDSHQMILESLYEYSIQQANVEDLVQTGARFWSGIVLSQPPDGFGYSLLRMADAEPSEARSRFFFRSAWRVAEANGRLEEPTIEYFWNFAQSRPERPLFAEVLLEESLVQIPDWDRKWKLEEMKTVEEAEETIQANMLYMQENIEAIRSGDDWGALIHLALLRKDFVFFAGRDLKGETAISELYGESMAAAAVEGLMNAVTNDRQPSFQKISEAVAKSRQYDAGWVVLLGMEEIWRSAPKRVLSLPESALARAVAYALYFSGHFENQWLTSVAEQNPTFLANTAEAFWRALLLRKANSLPGLYLITRRELFKRPAERLARNILIEFPRPISEILEELLSVSLGGNDRGWLVGVAEEELRNYRRLSSKQFLLWLTTGYVLDPGRYREKMIRHASQSIDKAATIYQLLASCLGDGENLDEFSGRSLTPMMAFDLLRGLGASCTPEDLAPPSGVVPSSWTVARGVVGMINLLAAQRLVETGTLLERLLLEPRLNPDLLTYPHSKMSG